jgi:sugar-phosphatase
MIFPGIAAIVFDLDGVLVNSIAVVEAAWRQWSVDRSLDSEHVLSLIHGRRKTEILALAAPALDAAGEVEWLCGAEQARIHLVTPISGAAAFVASLPKSAWAIATSGERAGALARLAQVGIAIPRVLISAENVAHGKPDPEVYLKAAEGLGVNPADCLVFEDAPLGIQAASAAGMTVAALLTTYPAEDLTGAAAIMADFTNVSAMPDRYGLLTVTVD